LKKRIAARVGWSSTRPKTWTEGAGGWAIAES
jgi:hypothetical protein